LQFAQANAHTKNFKRACFTNADKIVIKKIPNASKKIKIHQHAADKKIKPAGNSKQAQNANPNKSILFPKISSAFKL
jgi:hypothetical protein